MFKYFAVLAIAGAVIYGSQHPEVLGLSSASASGPDFKVWIETTHIPPNNDAYYILDVQSREDKPVAVTSVLMNDDPKCVNMALSPYQAGTSVKLGQVLRFPLGIVGFNTCEAVRVLISTDRGDAVYNFD
jgi:hypothetical protein